MSQHRQPQRIYQCCLILLILLLSLSQHPGRYDPYEPHRVGVMALLTAVLLPVILRRDYPHTNRQNAEIAKHERSDDGAGTGHALPLHNPHHSPLATGHSSRITHHSPLATHHSPLFWVAVGLWILALIISTLFALSPSRALFGDLIRRMGLFTHLLIISAALIGASLPKIGISLARVGRWFWLAGVMCACVVILQSVGILPNAYTPRAPGTIGVPTFAGGWLALALLWGCIGMIPTSSNNLALAPVFYALGLALIFIALILTGSRGAALSLLIGAWVGGVVWAIFSRRRAWICVLLGLVVMAAAGSIMLTRLDWNTSPLARLPLISRLNPSDDSTVRSRELMWGGTLILMTTRPTWANLEGVSDAFAGVRLWVGYGLESFETVFRPAMTPELREREDGRPVDRAHNDWLDTWVAAGIFGISARALLWLSVVIFALRLARDASIRREACLLLAIIVAHFVDLQFSFTTVVTGWSAWLAIGGLAALGIKKYVNESLRRQERQENKGAIYRAPTNAILFLNQRNMSYLKSSLWKIWVGMLLLILVLWSIDARADVLIQQALTSRTPAEAQALMTDALQTRGWDDRQYTLGVFSQLQALETWSPDQSLIWLSQAARRNPYDATTAFLLGVTWVERANRMQSDTAYQAAVTQAERYFAAAVRLSPLDGSYWREYARLAYWQLNNAPRAVELITRALELAPNDFAAQGLKAQIELLPFD